MTDVPPADVPPADIRADIPGELRADLPRPRLPFPPLHTVPVPAVPPYPLVPPQVLARFRARVLDPSTAVTKPGTTVSPTVYLTDTLLVRGLPDGRAGQIVKALTAANSMRIKLPIAFRIAEHEFVPSKRIGADDRARYEMTWTTRVNLDPAGTQPAPPVDAWEVLQTLRQDDQLRDEAKLAPEDITLEHLLTSCADLTGVGGAWGGVAAGGLAIYGSPGFGGRTPVVWSADDPYLPFAAAIADKKLSSPVVALLDTGLGDHPWFRDGTDSATGFTRSPSADGQTIGVVRTQESDPEYRGVVTDPLNGMIDREAGHGTFIAGIIRQQCPQAHLLTVPVMPADGAVAQGDVQRALNQLLWLHSSGEQRIDVLSLSMGYYHEDGDSAADDNALAQVLEEFVRDGVVVVAAAGNDATASRFLPAAYAESVQANGGTMVSVGALNPDGHTIALFSNTADWVTTYAPGAGIVSTIPVTLTGAQAPWIKVEGVAKVPRATVDPDDYRSGFAIWSGTSFAAPWVAGEIAQRIATGATPADAVADVLSERERMLTSIDGIREAVR